MRQYLDLLDDVLTNGKRKTDLQGIGNLAIFCREMRFRPAEEFPMITTKKLPLRLIVGELLWFLSGSSRWDFLHEHNITIWDEWGKAEVSSLYGLHEGDLGRIYGPQWVRWLARNGTEINQIQRLVDGLKSHPDSRRHKVIAWNPEDVDSVAVAPCHGDFKCFVIDGELSLHLNQRSCDMFLGVPFNMVCYSLLLFMLAQVTGLHPGEFIHTLEDVHIYLNHVEQVKLQLTREPRSLPKIVLNPDVCDIFGFTFSDFTLTGYNPHPHISGDVGI
ncbi:MAG: thymidylate synthase [Candidatus Zambryskibacteria bacterium RIFCSPLOWO2_02_FULL_39_26]|uniref:Thymidylate synthase n=1 Tax=Candidatus Zambryskibacteria bacterium RIFCSPLOWO2_12_FULL_39_23 TaxID=1802776 RepID=A0A1G2URD1_9BACT|nr:MAG: thymidylate synthase [Candidatus Zambryskibacteria bacterium RIFCSPHIGHO2_02_39_10]OHB00233.1 MAG: thymidylate synthase [Candidatus Zambryskibacteria bacterium RIFCSPHIGHO2_12_FULL_39_47]OHB10052.1 MAG: thymidylate synthase [Candidatus Zambryskibacteria bacterium RIFCSPLOWO2_02_FULL_39_26]OHB11882.1 MAG: thymidylate synthase [Candidatus Zambryskibacteria bacterium RIFCSPLOWO2_12_FULL_39_23]